MNNTTRRLRQRGFTLVEAMVALLVMAFGMLSLVGMQSMLTRNADAAKQRTEAQRLVQEKLECLRAFTQIDASTTVAATRNCMGALRATDTWDDLATVSSDPLNPLTSNSSNASYTRRWAIGGTIDDPLRPVSVTVSWTDRAGAAQALTMNSVISQSKPADEGALAFPLPQNGSVKRPKNRNLNIPIPAIDLGNGESAFQVGANFAVIFNNDSGYVVKKCSSTVTVGNYASLTAGGQCSNYTAYIVAGYISGDSSAWSQTDANLLPTGINTASVTGWDSSGGKTISCSYSPTTQVTDQNTGASVDGVYRYYLCVIPVTSGGTWSGTVRLSGMTTGNSNRKWAVCRFEYPASSFQSDNERNAQPYASVTGSLDSQNYYIAEGTGSDPCPTITNTVGNGQTQQTTSVKTTLHQDCRTSNSSNHATACPTQFTGS